MREKYLQRRNGVFYFHARLPAEISKALGAQFYRKSLRTNSELEAKKRRDILLFHLRNLVKLVRSNMISDEKIRSLVTKFFNGALAGFEFLRITDQELAAEAEKVIANFPRDTLKNLLRKNQTQIFSGLAKKFLEQENLVLDENSIQFQTLLREMLKAFAEICHIERKRDDGDYLNDYDKVNSYTMNANQGIVHAAKESQSPLLSQLGHNYVDEKKTANLWRDKTELDFNSYFETFIEIVGDINIDKVNHKMMLDYRDKLVKLPPNRKKLKLFKNKTIDQILALSNITPMTLKTVNNHLTLVSSFFKWATKHDYISKNPSSGLLFKLNVKPSEERKEYSKEDIVKILTEIKRVNINIRPERYWIPIIALLSGMRQNEICQLAKTDIRYDNETWYFDINAETDDKRAKTKSSQRQVPIHPILIDLGFLDYHKSVRTNQLWGNLKYDDKHGYAYLFQKWYQRLNREKVTKDPKKNFHSFRHSVANNLKQQKIASSPFSVNRYKSLVVFSFGRSNIFRRKYS